MMRALLIYGSLFVAGFGSARALTGLRAPAARTPQGATPADSTVRPIPPVPARATPRLGAASVVRPAGEPIDLSRLGELDQTIVQAPSVLRAQEIVVGRSVLSNALSAWVLQQARRCPGLKSAVPSRLELVVQVRAEGTNRAEVQAIESLTIAEGAPLPPQGLACIEAGLRRALPRVIEKPGLSGLSYEGSFRAGIQVNTATCTL
jgi:hypothetical protein